MNGKYGCFKDIIDIERDKNEEILLKEMKIMNGHNLDGRYGSIKDIIERADNEKVYMKQIKDDSIPFDEVV